MTNEWNDVVLELDVDALEDSRRVWIWDPAYGESFPASEVRSRINALETAYPDPSWGFFSSDPWEERDLGPSFEEWSLA